MLPLVLVALIASPGLASAANGDNITATESVSFTKRVADIDNCVFHDATIDWGDGSSSAGQFDTGTTPGVKGTHTYAEEGTFNGSVTYNTDCTTNAKVTFTATVADVGLNASGRDISATAGQPATGVVSHFTDADPNGTTSDYSAQINWGDGSSSAGTVSASSAGGFDVTGTHTYHSTGQAAVNVTIKDVGGASAPSSSTATIAAVPSPLKAAFGWYPEMPCQGGPGGGRPTFDASASQGAIATFRWTITDFNAPGNTEVYDNPTGWGPPGWEHPAGYPLNAQTVGTRVHFIRNPTTVTLTVFDSAGNSNSVQHTITYSDPVEVWIVKVGYTEAGAGVSTTYFPYYYLAPEHPHYCGGALLGSQYVAASFTSAPTTLSRTGSVTTTVTCPVRGDCAATLYVLRAGQVKGHLARAGSHVARRKRRVAPYLGRASFVVAAGRKRKIVIHLKKRARRLARAGRLKKVELLLITRGHKPRVVTVRLHRKRH